LYKKVIIIVSFLACLSAFSQQDSLNPKSILRPDTSLVIFGAATDSLAYPEEIKPPGQPKDFIHVEFHFGLSKPIGSYADDYYANPLAGYAREGTSLGFNFYYHLNDEVDVLFSWSRQTNTFGVNEFSRNALESKNNYQLRRDANWKNNFILLGASANFKLSEHNFFTPRFLLGFCSVKTPEYTIEPSNKKATAVSETIAAQRQTRFALKIGFGLKKNLRNNLTLSLNPDFFYSSTSQNINKPYFKNLNTSQNISTISFCVALGYRITTD